MVLRLWWRVEEGSMMIKRQVRRMQAAKSRNAFCLMATASNTCIQA
jgi:hypothetical protein